MSNPKPERGNVEPLPIQTTIGAIFRAIAKMRPQRGMTLSESALIMRGVGSREAVQLAFAVLTDFGTLSPLVGQQGRVGTLFKFHDPFSLKQVDDVLDWAGLSDEFVDGVTCPD